MKPELLRFLIVGLITVGVDLAAYSLAKALGVYSPGAKAVGFITGTVFSYLANSLWTFQSQLGMRKLLSFLAVYCTTLVANVTINELVIYAFGGSQLGIVAGFVVATGTSASLNFLGMKYFVYRQESARPVGEP